MTAVPGHVAMGLLWALPAWFVWERRTVFAFLGIVIAAALTPDVDLLLEALFPSLFYHHGVTHTIGFVIALSVAVGAVAAAVARRTDRRLGGEQLTARRAFGFVSAAVLVGGLSHLFADLLSAPDIAAPLKPFWPIIEQPVILDVIWYASPTWNYGLLLAAVLLHVVAASISRPIGGRSSSTDA